jgi:acyl-CoA synthetase (AMP-forming)/AMP-acid ligase II
MGVTGLPLPVALSQAALLAAGRALAAGLGLRPGDRYLSLSHLSSPWTLQEFFACLHAGAGLSVLGWAAGPRALAKEARRLPPAFVRMSHAAFMENYGAYFRPGPAAGRRLGPDGRLRASAARLLAGGRVPAALRAPLRLAARAPLPGGRPPALILSCGSLSPAELAVMKAAGQPVIHSYGLTEACGFVTLGRPGESGQGRPLPGADLRIGEDGEIQVSGPALMSGYLAPQPEKAPPGCAVEGGWMSTRDFGRLDGDGRLHYESGRRYRLVFGDAPPIPCDRIEALLMKEPLVARATVVGGRRIGLRCAVALIDPDLDAMDRLLGPRAGRREALERWEREHLKSCLRARLRGLPQEQQPRAFLFSASDANYAWSGRLCPDRRTRRIMIQPRDNFDLLYLQLTRRPKPEPPPGILPEKGGEPLFLSVESEFDRPLMRHDESRKDYGFKSDKVLGGGIPTLLGALEQAGWDPDYIPYRFQWHMAVQPQVDRLVEFLSRRPGRIIAAGCASVALPFLLRALEEVARLQPERRIILGGCGPSAAARAVLEHFPFVSAVVMGEAELSLPAALEALAAGGDLSRVPGVSARAPDGSVSLGVPKRITDLDSLPAPSYARINLDLYHHVSVPTMRGCPKQCKFCGNSAMYGPGVSLRSLDKVMDELRYLHRERDQNYFFIGDDTFTLLKPRVLDFCARMRAEFGRKVSWFCYASIDSLDTERMRAMSDAGCRSIFVGVESGSRGMLGRYKGTSHYTPEDALARLKEARRYFASVQAGLIVGFPEEGLLDFLQTLRLGDKIMRGGYGDVVFHWLKAIPLTPLFEESRKSLIIPPQVKLYKGTSQYCRWAADLARKDPALAPWSVQIPTPYARLKDALLWRYLRDHWEL